MSALQLGQRMVRVSDGQLGVVALKDGVPRIVYQLMADEVLAPSREHWVAEALPRLPLREEEIERVASTADQVLRCLETHTPWRFWEEADPNQVHDRGLTEVIKRYLRERT